MFWNRTKKDIADKVAFPVGKTIQLPLSFLKKLIPIGNLPNDELKQLQIKVSKHKPGNVIFNQGEYPQALSFIIEGQCYLESIDGNGYVVEADTLKALYPLSNITKHFCTAIAKSNVSLIHLPLDALARCNTDKRNPLLRSADVPEHLKHDLFFQVFSEYFKKDKLIIPTLPNTAMKLRSAIQKNIGIKEAAQIVNLDAIISSKLVSIANSPLYRTVTPINSTLDAINRLGLTTTRNLVVSLSLKHLYKSKNSDFNKRIQMLWKQSVHVSSISFILASLNKTISPDEALLAGLIHNIGAYPIIIYADTQKEQAFSESTIDNAIINLQGLLGNITLENWGFPKELTKLPRESENWFHYNSPELDLCDIVILAKYHSLIAGKQSSKLPPIHTLPAFQKINDNALTPNMTLKVIHGAQKQISEAMRLFGQ